MKLLRDRFVLLVHAISTSRYKSSNVTITSSTIWKIYLIVTWDIVQNKNFRQISKPYSNQTRADNAHHITTAPLPRFMNGAQPLNYKISQNRRLFLDGSLSMIKKSSTQFLSSTVLSGYNFSAKCQCFEKVFLIILILLIRLARIHFVKKHWQTCWFEYFSVCFVWKLWTYKLMTLGMFTNAEPFYWSANITNVIN